MDRWEAEHDGGGGRRRERSKSRARRGAGGLQLQPGPHHYHEDLHHHHEDLHHQHIQHDMSVLYVYEGIGGGVGEAMAAARDRSTRYHSVQRDTTLALPYQVPLPDGEERHYIPAHMRHHPHNEQDAEITRGYIKPPANKTLFDVGLDTKPRQDMYSSQSDLSLVPSYHSRASHHPSSSSSSSSSSLSGWECGDEGRGSRKSGGLGQRGTQLIANIVAPFTSSKYDRAPSTPHHEGRRMGRQQSMGTSSPSHDPTIPYQTAANTLADIAMVPSLPCGPTSLSPSHLSGPGSSQGVHGGSMGHPRTYGEPSQSRCSPTVDPHRPPFYDDMIENPTFCTSVSRPSEPRTNSGKI